MVGGEKNNTEMVATSGTKLVKLARSGLGRLTEQSNLARRSPVTALAPKSTLNSSTTIKLSNFAFTKIRKIDRLKAFK